MLQYSYLVKVDFGFQRVGQKLFIPAAKCYQAVGKRDVLFSVDAFMLLWLRYKKSYQ